MSKSKYYQEELEKELQNKQKKQRGKKVLIRSSIAVGAISVIGGIALATSMKTLDEGQIGIVTEFGKITKIEREAGVKFIKPFGINTITKMDIKTKVKSVEMEASSKDEQKVTAKVSYNYHLDSSKAEELYREVGADWERILLEESNIILQCFKNEAVKYNVESILTNREVISEDTKKAINEKLQKYGIVVDSFNAANLDFSKEYNAAVEKKQIAEQEAKTAIPPPLRSSASTTRLPSLTSTCAPSTARQCLWRALRPSSTITARRSRPTATPSCRRRAMRRA